MEKIEELIAKLENNIPTKIKNKLKSLERLNDKLSLAKKEHEDEPTEASKGQLDSVSEYVEEVQEELIEDLEKEVIKVEKAKQIIVEEPVIVVAPVETKEITKPIVENTEPKKEESNGIGWFGLLGGVVLLFATAGLVNTLRK